MYYNKLNNARDMETSKRNWSMEDSSHGKHDHLQGFMNKFRSSDCSMGFQNLRTFRIKRKMIKTKIPIQSCCAK